MIRRAAFDTREELLHHAGRVFAASGYEGASMSRIASEAGVSKGTPYNYFASKAALFAAYVQWECRNNLALVFDGLGPDGDVATALRGVGERILRLILSPQGLPIRQLAEWLDARTRTGELRVPDTELAAEQFFTLCKTRHVMRRELRLIGDIPEAEMQLVVEATVSLFLAAYGPG